MKPYQRVWRRILSKVYTVGHSAGGYLTLMLCLDKDYLGKLCFDADWSIKGYFPDRRPDCPHYTIRRERGYLFHLTDSC